MRGHSKQARRNSPCTSAGAASALRACGLLLSTGINWIIIKKSAITTKPAQSKQFLHFDLTYDRGTAQLHYLKARLTAMSGIMVNYSHGAARKYALSFLMPLA